jgi:hypothetical protein
MSFDISRSTFRPRKNFLGVVMQQGRVQLDSDWNEWQSEFSRRIQAGTLDTVGQAVYPSSTPNAFKITPGTDASGNLTLTIGAGRYYVDGLLAENHGPKAQSSWDTSLAELSGSPFGSAASAVTDFTQQPYYPGAKLPTGNGPFLAYLDVWERDVTYLEDPNLIDKAVGIDTTGRLQTVWQVKTLDLSSVSGTPDCSTDVSAYDALLQPPAAQLTNGLVPNAAAGPCCLAPNTGFTGQENQLYRIQIHQAGTIAAGGAGFNYPLPAGTPTFKWSRDNASVATSVSAISTVTTSSGSVSQLTVASLGRDPYLGFVIGNWIEITDDVHELNGQPGEMYLITNAVNNTLTLNGTVSANFPLTSGQTDSKLHTRILRWDQSGKVSQTDTSGNTTPWIDLNAPGSTGDIPIPPAGTTLVLENGITVAFGLNPTTGVFNSGDYWNFSARTADGSIDPLTNAPPRGIYHHYARLSVFNFSGTPSDCRVEWPHAASGSCCECSVTFGPADISGNNTLQSIFDKYQNQASAITICLEAGTYSLPTPLRLTSAHTNITLEACQPGSVTLQALPGNEAQFNDGLIVLDNVEDITLSGLDFVVPAAVFAGTTFAGLPLTSLTADVASLLKGLLVSIGVRMVNASNVTISNCSFDLASTKQQEQQDDSALFAAGIFASGENDGVRVEGNQFIPDTANKRIYGQQSFLTGFLLASSVSFGSQQTIPAPPPAPAPPAPAPPAPAPTANLSGAIDETAKKEVPRIDTARPGVNPGDIALSGVEKEGITGIQYVGGQFQNIGGFTLVQPSLASQGGTVLAATLDDASFRNNTFTRLDTAALMLGEPGDIDIIANQIEKCEAGFWILTPSQTQSLLIDPQGIALLGATIALGYPLPLGDTGTYIATVAAAPASTRIYTGSQNYTDSNKNVWLPDASAPNVTVTSGSLAHPVPLPPVTGTSDPGLYQSERYGPNFSYTFNSLVSGYYSLTLKFAEIFYTDNASNKGVRVFNVAINSQQVLTDFDIAADIGGADLADDYTFANIPPNEAGQIVVTFTGTNIGSDGNAKISAAELDPQWSGAPFLGAGNESGSATFFDQLAQLAEQGYANLGYSLAQLRIQDNEMHFLGAPGLLLLGDDSVMNGNSGSLMMTGNRIDGEIDTANLAPGVNGTIGASEFEGDAFASIGIVGALRSFLTMVVIVQVSQAVVTSNMIASGNSADGYGFSLFLNDAAVLKAAIAVMSNVFEGNILVRPPRVLAVTDYDAFLKTWNFLNTIVVS